MGILVLQEAYCWALRELKEAIKEPQQETLEFIDKMHSQLTELTITNPAPPPNTSSGNLFFLFFLILQIHYIA